MHKRRTYIENSYIVAACVIIILLLLVQYFSALFESDDHQVQRVLDRNNIPYSMQSYETGQHRIRYVDVGDQTNPVIMFVHGSPGSLASFLPYATDKNLMQDWRMILVDRPGYGKGQAAGEGIISISKQADVIAALIDHLSIQQPLYLLGHSYGGPIAATITARHPEMIDKLILTAAALDPDSEQIFFMSRILDWGFVQWMLSPLIKNINADKLSHQDYLREVMHEWQDIQTPTAIVHYQDDRLVPVESAYMIHKTIQSAPVSIHILSGDYHSIFRKRPDMFASFITQPLHDN